MSVTSKQAADPQQSQQQPQQGGKGQQGKGGGAQEFEQAFFQLAYDKLQSKLYNLLPFLVGFELVKKNDSNSRAVGVFGFKSDNGQILFVPAFFINGKVKDMDIMYSRNNNQFYPLNEDFAELFLKDDVTGLGTPGKSTKEQVQKDTQSHGMRQVLYPPRGRVTYASMKNDDDFCLTLNKTAQELTSTPVDVAIKSSSLLHFVKECGVQDAFWGLLEKDAAFCDAVRHFYTDEELAGALVKDAATKIKESPKLKVVRFGEKIDDKDLNPKSVKELTNRGFSIVDNRASQDVSQVGLFKYTETFSNPTSSGFYPYITELGTLRYGVVLLSPIQLHANFSSNQAILLDLEAERSGQAYISEVSNIFVKDCITLKDFSSVHKQLEEPAESMPGYDDYILLNDKLVTTQPFRVVENYKDGSGIRRLKVQPTLGEDFSPIECKGKPSTVTLVLTKRDGDTLEHRNSAVYVPKNFKLLKLHTSDYFCSPCGSSESMSDTSYKTRRDADEKERSRIKQGRPGGLHHLDAFLREKNIFPLTVQNNGSEYYLSVAGVKTKYDNALECKIGMVTHVGMDEPTADEVMSKIALSHPLEGMIKIAYLGDETLNLVDEQPWTNELGQSTYSGVPYYDHANQSDGYQGDPTQPGLGVKPDVNQVQNNVQNATALAQSGQKEIFDTQSIATLARYSNPNDKIMGYIPNFVSSLDKLGRMLFMVYWETEKFQDMYGKDEMPELVELVKNVFNNLGDLIIFMKRKVPDLSINNNEQSESQL